MILKDEIKKILIVNPFGIGDVLFTTPVIRAIKEKHRSIFIGYWCNERVKEILVNNQMIDKVFDLSRGDLKKIFKVSKIKGIKSLFGLIKKIRREKFDLVLDYSLDNRYGLICKLAGIRKRIGFDYKGRGKFLTSKKKITGYANKHIIEIYADLLKNLNLKPYYLKMDLNVTKEARNHVLNLLKKEGVKEKDCVIAISPAGGASWGKDAYFKLWPAENFTAVAEKAIKKFNAKILLLGDNSEKSITSIISSYLKENVIDLTGKTTLMELAAFIEKSDILVTNDGGPLHMAVALGTKTVSLFGPVDQKVYGPYPHNEMHVVIKSNIECRPCYKDFRFSKCKIDKECLKSISPDRVFEAVRKLVEKGN